MAKKLFLAQAQYEEHWLVWAEDENEASNCYWEEGKQVVNDMPWAEINEISPEDALRIYKEIPRDE